MYVCIPISLWLARAFCPPDCTAPRRRRGLDRTKSLLPSWNRSKLQLLVHERVRCIFYPTLLEIQFVSSIRPMARHWKTLELEIKSVFSCGLSLSFLFVTLAFLHFCQVAFEFLEHLDVLVMLPGLILHEP